MDAEIDAVPRGTLYHSYALESGRLRHGIIRTPSMANIGAMQYACIGTIVFDYAVCIFPALKIGNTQM